MSAFLNENDLKVIDAIVTKDGVSQNEIEELILSLKNGTHFEYMDARFVRTLDTPTKIIWERKDLVDLCSQENNQHTDEVEKDAIYNKFMMVYYEDPRKVRILRFPEKSDETYLKNYISKTEGVTKLVDMETKVEYK